MSNLYRFADFVLDPASRTLCRADALVPLTPKAFDVLLFLAQNPNRPILKEELLQAVWEKTFVEEGNLAQYISHLRKALGDNAENTRLIATIAGKGYQFTARVTVAAEPADSANHATLPVAAIAAPRTNGLPKELAAPQHETDLPLSHFRPRRWFAALALLTVIGGAAWFYRSYRKPLALSPTDTIVVATLKNETSDPVFDDALDSALRYELAQTPYLNTLGNDKIVGTLAQLKLPPTTKLTPDIARQICGKTNSKLVISPSLSDVGNGYHLQLRALDCASGATLATEQADIAKRNEVVHELGVTAARFRAKLGETPDSLQRFNQPLEEALSSSPEALQVSAQGLKLSLSGDAQGALKLYQRAVELDPSLAVAHWRMGAAYLFLGNTELAEASYTRAYQLRDHLTERDRLGIEIDYYGQVVGNWEKEYSFVQRFLEIFPRDVLGHANLRAAYVHLGQPDRAADAAAETARLRPSPYYFGSAIQSIRFASRFSEAKSWLANADSLKLDNSLIRREKLIVAFATNDNDAVAKILKEQEQGSYRDDFLREHSEIEVQQGRFRSAERLRQQALSPTSKAPDASWWLVFSALENAEVGNDLQARRMESEALGGLLDRNTTIALALAMARSGRAAEAAALADQLSAQRPDDTIVQHYFLPTIRAAIKLRQHNAAAAIALLRDSSKYDLAFTGSVDSVYPAYIRGLAYLDLGDGPSATAQFLKLIDNRGFAVRHVIGPLAWLQLARAQKISGDEPAAQKSYETFLKLWNQADSNIPIYQQAKSEFAQLPNQSAAVRRSSPISIAAAY